LAITARATEVPTPRPEHEVTDEELIGEDAAFFRHSHDLSTDDEYQKIRKLRTAPVSLEEVDIPAGYAPVTFLEADTILIAPIGSNLRELALANDIPLYVDAAKVLNCRGLGLCTTCRVSVDPPEGVTAPTKTEQEHLIKYNPKQRLSCQCEITGPVKVSTKPAREYGLSFSNFVRGAAVFGVFSLVMLFTLLIMGFDVVGSWF
jgi:ferredoxin